VITLASPRTNILCFFDQLIADAHCLHSLTPLHLPGIVFSMKKLLIVLLVLGISTQACNLSGQTPATPITTPTPPSVSIVTPLPTNTPTSTPTLVPTFTPTPVPEVRAASGDHALFNGDYDMALSEYSAALTGSADPAIQAAAILGQGRIHYLTGDYPNALNEFRTITDRYSGYSQAAAAYFFLAETYMQLDRYSEAADAFASYLTIRPGILDAFINELRGDAFTANGDYSPALAAYISAVQSPRLPTNFALELKLAQTYTVLGDYVTAGVVYDDIFSRTSSEDIKAQVDYARGQMYSAMGQAEQATAAYVDAVYNYPHAYYSYLSLVELVNTGYPVSDLQRGLVDYDAGESGVALAAFNRYISLNPSDASTALYYKGLILRDQEDLPSAISVWDSVINGDQASPVWDSAWEQKAYTQWAYQDDYIGAEKTLLDFVAAVPAHPRAAEFLFDAARVVERDNRLADAARLWQRIPIEYPNSEYVFRAMFLAGICHFRLADYAEAQTVFWQVRDITTTPADRAGAYFWVGKAQSAQGDASSAQTTWQQAASIDPTGYYSERARDMLNNLPPFTPPLTIDLGIDRQSELKQAEQWMLTTFNYPPATDLSVPGPIASDPRFVRGQEFWRLGLYDQAEAEFSNMRDEAAGDPLTSYRLAVFLSDLGMYRQAILAARQVLDLAGLDDAGTLTAPVLFSHIRFGAYFPDLVAPVAQDYGFNPLFIWSTIRQESLFDPSIQSSAGAFGLMQVLPVTGQDIALRLGWPPSYTQSDLLRPHVNLTLGQDYLADQRDNLGGDLYAALAAYNGGPGNAAAWQSLAKGDPDLFVEVVRFDETRQYLMGIYEVFNIYSRLYARVQ
jgi:soluble lytic murein transglycosylase